MKEKNIEKRNFAWPVTSINVEDYTVFRKTIVDNRVELNKKKIIVFGAGIRGSALAIMLEEMGYKEFIFTDNNCEKWGGYINQHSIVPIDEVYKQRGKVMIFISIENGREIKDQLEERGFKEGQDYIYLQTDLYAQYMEEFLKKTNNKILAMGDCEFSTISLGDKDTTDLADMLRNLIGAEQIKVLSMHGMGLRAHYNVLKSQLALGMKPQILVIMINFDTLTGKQHLLPRSQHVDLIRQIYNASNNKDKELGDYLKLVEERVNNVQVEFFTGESRSPIENEENRSRVYFKLNYMYKLSTENEGLIYLKKILALASRERIKVIPFIPPVNYQLAERLLGEMFLRRYESNVEILRQLLQEEGYELFDLSYCLQPSEFAAMNTPDETANAKGRQIVANHLQQLIEAMY